MENRSKEMILKLNRERLLTTDGVPATTHMFHVEFLGLRLKCAPSGSTILEHGEEKKKVEASDDETEQPSLSGILAVFRGCLSYRWA
eukprot:scaffold3450_cov114-Cylindrotheca_fusiformis.AAC.20